MTREIIQKYKAERPRCHKTSQSHFLIFYGFVVLMGCYVNDLHPTTSFIPSCIYIS